MALDFPASPNVGDQHEEQNMVWEWTAAGVWQVLGGPSLGAGTTYGPTFPVDPEDGQQHYLTTEPVGTYVWVNDGNSTQWVQGHATGTSSGGGNPPGTVIDFAGVSQPDGYLKCDGTILNIADFPALYAAIGVLYGGDDVTTFALPDLRGEFVRGFDDGRGVDTDRVMGEAQAEDWKGFWMKNTGQNTSSYSHGPLWMGKITSPDDTGTFTGNLFTGGWSAPAAATGILWGDEEVRPRNMAMLKCIKT